jgi:hypothetical protein
MHRTKAVKISNAIILSLLTLALASCGVTGTTPGSSGQPTLQCSVSVHPQGVDVLATTLTCTVTGAPTDQTGFQLYYTTTSSSGMAHRFDQPCQGNLNNETGTCTQTYAIIAPASPTPATVSGALLPSQQALGPITIDASHLVIPTTTPGY